MFMLLVRPSGRLLGLQCFCRASEEASRKKRLLDMVDTGIKGAVLN